MRPTSTAHDDLEPIDPRTAQELYLKLNETECAEKTVQAHRYRTNYFVRWCTDSEIGNLNELTGRDIQKYRLWRQEDGDLKQIAMNQQMSTLRVFRKWCCSIEAVPANLYEKVLVPRVRPANQRNDETLDSETARQFSITCAGIITPRSNTRYVRTSGRREYDLARRIRSM